MQMLIAILTELPIAPETRESHVVGTNSMATAQSLVFRKIR